MLAQMLDPTIFQSTPSARRATGALHPEKTGEVISIHALREEGDCWWCIPRSWPSTNFNPRPPRGGRPCGRPWQSSTTTFQSTPSARRATDANKNLQSANLISIHALREEGDRHEPANINGTANFNPRPPRGGRRATYAYDPGAAGISIHALREEGDYLCR